MKNLLFIRKWHYFASIVLMLLVVSSCFGDITQYKRIGETDYYLVETENLDLVKVSNIRDLSKIYIGMINISSLNVQIESLRRL